MSPELKEAIIRSVDNLPFIFHHARFFALLACGVVALWTMLLGLIFWKLCQIQKSLSPAGGAVARTAPNNSGGKTFLE